MGALVSRVLVALLCVRSLGGTGHYDDPRMKDPKYREMKHNAEKTSGVQRRVSMGDLSLCLPSLCCSESLDATRVAWSVVRRRAFPLCVSMAPCLGTLRPIGSTRGRRIS